MKSIFKHIKGDKGIWAIVTVLSIASFMPVYSASTNLVYVIGSGSTLGYLVKHVVLLIMGFVIIYGVHKIPYRFFLEALFYVANSNRSVSFYTSSRNYN